MKSGNDPAILSHLTLSIVSFLFNRQLYGTHARSRISNPSIAAWLRCKIINSLQADVHIGTGSRRSETRLKCGIADISIAQ